MNIIYDQDPGYIGAVKEYFYERINNLCELQKVSKANKDKFDFEILLLACCSIDALANIFTDEKEVGKRFVGLLIYIGEINNINFSKVNLISLNRQISIPQKDERPLPSKYYEWVSGEIGKRDYSTGDNTTLDLTDNVILEKLFAISSEEEKKRYGSFLVDRIKKSTYAGVLYENYRNPLVHEAQAKGHWGGQDETKPFYIDIMGMDADLSFPSAFLIETVKNLLSELCSECEERFLKREVGEG